MCYAYNYGLVLLPYSHQTSLKVRWCGGEGLQAESWDYSSHRRFLFCAYLFLLDPCGLPSWLLSSRNARMFSRFVLVEREAAVISTANSWPVCLQSVLHGFYWIMKPFVGSTGLLWRTPQGQVGQSACCVTGCPGVYWLYSRSHGRVDVFVHSYTCKHASIATTYSTYNGVISWH